MDGGRLMGLLLTVFKVLRWDVSTRSGSIYIEQTGKERQSFANFIPGHLSPIMDKTDLTG
jgi:hypothetical protein